MGVSTGYRLLLICYSLVYSAGLLLYSGLVTLRRMTGGRRSPVLARLGLPSSIPARDPGDERPRVWIHAVSVGELNAVRPVIRAMLERSDRTLCISTTTSTGQELARRDFGDRATVFYFPCDLRLVCRRYLQRLRPSLVVLAETELWPSFLAEAARADIPVVLINGRLSDTSFRRYLRFAPLFRPSVQSIAHFCMQTKADKHRVLSLGADPDRVNWIGNLKFDYRHHMPPELSRLNERLRTLLCPGPDDLLLICGSTKPGEEEQLAQVVSRLARDGHNLKLIVAPRHPHRGAEVVQILDRAGFETRLRSRLDLERTSLQRVDALVLDSIGELAGVYEIADLVFVGGSLVAEGGQNVIEPAAFAKPILFGPHMDNFREIAAAFTSNYAALQVQSAAELEARLADLMGDAHARAWLGRNARKVIRDNQGALSRTLEVLESFL